MKQEEDANFFNQDKNLLWITIGTECHQDFCNFLKNKAHKMQLFCEEC